MSERSQQHFGVFSVDLVFYVDLNFFHFSTHIKRATGDYSGKKKKQRNSQQKQS